MVVVAAIPVEGLAITDRWATPDQASKVPLQRLVLCEKAYRTPVCDDNSFPRPGGLEYRLRRKPSVRMAMSMILAKPNHPRTMIVRHRDVLRGAVHDLVRGPHMYPKMRRQWSLPVSPSNTAVIATGHGHENENANANANAKESVDDLVVTAAVLAASKVVGAIEILPRMRMV